MRRANTVWTGAFVALLLATPGQAATSPTPPNPYRAIEFRYTPTARAQIAIWVEKPDGTFMGTVRLTQAVSYFGIGNRPGASQMNSGFRWPYGRRLDVLPVWAHRRAAAAGAVPFKQVIFQNRTYEGCASNAGCGGADSSPDAYFCLSFRAETTRKEALDAVSCATPFASDKGRYLTAAEAAAGYAEPVESRGVGTMRPLEVAALYPPRRDGAGCGSTSGCIDHPDPIRYAADARAAMPDIDAVTMATPPGNSEQSILFTIPKEWPDNDYVAWIEVNVEGDHNMAFNPDIYRTPRLPTNAWDSWAIDFGYPYRGQPSVVFSIPFSLAATGSFSTARPTGYSDVDGFGPAAGKLNAMDGTITDEPGTAAGSGADRLRLMAPRDYRVQVNVQFCQEGVVPQSPTAVAALPHREPKHTHEWGRLQFRAPTSERPIDHYEVRYSKSTRDPITMDDPSSFARALPAVAAQTDSVALVVPTSVRAGEMVDVNFGGLEPLTEYTVAVRAVDSCNLAGPYVVTKLSTTKINFTQLSGCFIATAAYGSAMEPEVQALRAVRDVVRPRSALFAMATDLYYRSGPAAAAVIARSELARALVRSVLAPAVDLARAAAPLIQAGPSTLPGAAR